MAAAGRSTFRLGSKAAGHVHYVTFRPGTLAGKSWIVVRYRVDARAGTRFVPQANPDRAGTVSLYLQRRGDDWNARGRYQYYRWYAPAASVRELAPGAGEISVRLDDPQWISVLGQPSADYPGAMAEALADVERVGLVFGSSNARGHGVYATALGKIHADGVPGGIKLVIATPAKAGEAIQSGLRYSGLPRRLRLLAMTSPRESAWPDRACRPCGNSRRA
ncbi:hypothetical protein [Sphingopyxis sp. PET50]|uniref:hypothetical protein n=1 Tax=Sphingopyxis sp. PET50 TaxID=2976533 RepID=UPI0021B00D03|nr:hypothetical protein [Sphingopyxis sp. PET50]